MEKYAKYSKFGSQLFDGLNYDFWNIRMNLFLQSLGLDVWQAVVNGYTPLNQYPPAYPIDIILFESN